MLPGCAFCPAGMRTGLPTTRQCSQCQLTCCALAWPAQTRQPLKLIMWAVQVGQRWDEFSTEEQAQLASITFSLLQQGQSPDIERMWPPSCRNG